MITVLPDSFVNIKSVDIALGDIPSRTEAQFTLRDGTTIYTQTTRQGLSVIITTENDVQVFSVGLNRRREDG